MKYIFTGITDEKVQITVKTNEKYHPSSCVILIFPLSTALYCDVIATFC